MAHLSLAGVSDDGRRLLLVDDRGAEHTLEVTGALRAALRGDSSRLGQLEITMESALRPRDIQSRIRSGESPEEVASAAQTTVEAIMPFVGPVLAEREHVAERARRAHVRRPAGETGGARVLGEAVAAHLRASGAEPDDVGWDAWKRPDGRWTLTADFAGAGPAARTGTAHFTFDAPGSFVLLDDDDARWLVGDELAAFGPAGATGPAARDDLDAARRRRLAALGGEELPLGEDAIDLVHPGHHVDPLTDPLTDPLPGPLDDVAPAAGPGEPGEPGDPADTAVRPPLPPAPDEPDVAPDGPVPPTAQDADGSSAEPEEEPGGRRPVTKRKGRASVPSWEEIMFGGGDR